MLQGLLPLASLISSSSFISISAVSTSGQEAKSRAVQKHPVVLIFLETCIRSLVSIGACCFKVRLLCGMLSALIHYPGHILSPLECKMYLSGSATRLSTPQGL